jgi:hypothetical protein
MFKAPVRFLVGLLLLPASQLLADEWNFEVYLNDKKVGTHLFRVLEADDQRQVQSIADFNVKFLFFSAYSYEHTAVENWDDDCLSRFDAQTNVNGKPTAVSGESAESGFIVERSDSTELLPDCVMSFAYWNPMFLQQERLLNPQTGEYLDVKVELLGTDSLEVRGKLVEAQRYKVTAKDIDLLVWYADNDQWVALESVAKTGHVIRYELS